MNPQRNPRESILPILHQRCTSILGCLFRMTGPLLRFYDYQKAWLADESRFKVGMFARQTGKTFTACAEIVRECLRAELHHRSVHWVILSRGERQAREAMAKGVLKFLEAMRVLLEDSTHAPGLSRLKSQNLVSRRATELTFRHGSKITALPANPDTARGYSANLLLDEFAFHRQDRAIWAALFPVISEPGLKLRVISTPNGRRNKFYDLMTGDSSLWSRHQCNIYQAVEQGLPRDIRELRDGMEDETIWRQEYELGWQDDTTPWLSWELICAAEAPPEAFPTPNPLHTAASGSNRDPDELYHVFMGVDIAIRNDLFVIVVLQSHGHILWTRDIMAHRALSFSEQDFLLDKLVGQYRPHCVAMDQTGLGEKPVEDAKHRYRNTLVLGVSFTQARKYAMASELKARLQKGTLRLPAEHQALRADLHAVQRVAGWSGIPYLKVRRDGARNSDAGHGDRFWALALAVHAAARAESTESHENFSFMSRGRERSGSDTFGSFIGGSYL